MICVDTYAMRGLAALGACGAGTVAVVARVHWLRLGARSVCVARVCARWRQVVTSHDQLGETGKPTGFWLEELAAPFYILKDAGCAITIATPKGGQPPCGEPWCGHAAVAMRARARARGCKA